MRYHRPSFSRIFLPSLLLLLLTVLTCGSAQAWNYYYFPHLAHGPIGSGMYSTSFSLSSNSELQPSGTANSITIQYLNEHGSYLDLVVYSPDRTDINGPGTALFNMAKGESLVLQTASSSGPPQVGWCRITSAFPLTCSEEFVFNVGGSIMFSAGVLPSPSGDTFALPLTMGSAEPTPGLTTDVGLALVSLNTGGNTQVGLRLCNRNGAVVSEKSIWLEPNGYKAAFLSSIFSDYSFGSHFHGRVEIAATSNIAAVALKGLYGGASSVFSTLAVQPGESLSTFQLSEWEDNNSIYNADSLPVFGPAEITGSFVNATMGQDADFFLVNPPSGHTLRIIPLSIGLGMNGDSEWSVELRDKDNNLLVKHDSLIWHNDPDPIVYATTYSGAYYIVVRGWPGAGRNGYRLFVY